MQMGRWVVGIGTLIGVCTAAWVLLEAGRPKTDAPPAFEPAPVSEVTPALAGHATDAQPNESAAFVDAAEALRILQVANTWELTKYLQHGLHKPLPPDGKVVAQLVARLRTAPDDGLLATLLRGHLASMPTSFLSDVAPLLQDERAKVRWQALQVLIEWRQADASFRIPHVLACLEDDDASVRREVMRLLLWGTPFDQALHDGLVSIVEAERSGDAPGRHSAVAAARALAVMGDPAFDTLLAMLPQADAELARVIYGAMRYASRERIQRALPALREGLRSDVATVREAALAPMRALGIRAAPALPELLVLLQGEHEGLTRSALYVVAALGAEGREALPAVIALLGDPHEHVAEAASTALGSIAGGDASARRALANYVRDHASDQAAKALAAFGPAGLADAVEILESGDDLAAYAALWTLATLGSEAASAVPLLIPMIAQEDDRLLRDRAVATAGLIGPEAKATIPAIMRALASPELPLSYGIAGTALGGMAREAEPALRAALGSRDPLLRRQVAGVVSRWKLRARFVLDGLGEVLSDDDVETRRLAVQGIVGSIDEIANGQRSTASDAYLDRVASLLAKAAGDDDSEVSAQASYGQRLLEAERRARSR